MKSIINSCIFILVFSINAFAQVGINTDVPTATLDVVSNNLNINTVQVKNVSDDMLLSVNNEGDLKITGALMPNNNFGKSGDFLISQGPNLPPKWGQLQNHNGNLTIQEFNASRNTISTESTTPSTFLYWDFPNINVNVSSEIGSWDSSTRRFTVNRAGIYHITAGGEARNMTTANPSLFFVIEAGGVFQGGGNLLFVEDSQKNISAYSVLSIFLNPGDYIRVGANSGTSTWTMGMGYLNIQYSSGD